jgi:lipid II:glycine glycyltransferase (peptidoglycan interpeptide bridge formation enzyme)
MEIISDPQQINFFKLEKFVFQHPNGNFFQSMDAFRFYQSVDYYNPILIVAMDNEDVVGSLLAIIISEGKGLKGFFSRRGIIWGGPLVEDENADVYYLILNEFNKIAQKKAIYTQFRNLYDLNREKLNFSRQNWLFQEHLNIIIDLSQSEENLWKDVHSKRRNEIRRAEKEGTSFRVLENKSELSVTYTILKEVYDRAKLPLPDYRFFETAFDLLAPNNFKIFLGLNEGKIIGTMYILCFKDIMYDWFAGSYQAYYKKYPNDLIPWKVFLWGKKNGYNEFDFGGAGKPGVPYGVRDYKKKFGGKFVNYGRFEKIHNPFLYQFGKLGLKAWQRFKR